MNKKSHTFLIVATICFLVSASVFLYALYEVNKQGVRYAESKKLIGEQTAKEASYNTVQSLLESTRDDRAQIKSLFIEEDDTISFISEIEKNTGIVGVALTTNELSIMPSTTDTNGVTSPALLLVGFDFSGSQNAVWQYLTLLENIPYHKQMTQISFVKSDNNLWKANVKMQLTLRYD
ncbi:hypothetical protein K2P47_02205 [Patescibacteria group bacterium]|nr:hypothetical protein [Patescibacteria group bacterium]